MNQLSHEYFLAVARAGSIRQAARELLISQQALSEHIHRIENELGVKLLTGNRPAELTPCGKRFVTYCNEMLYQRRRLERELEDLSGKKHEIIISMDSSDYPPFLVDTITQFARIQPDCRLTLKERSGAHAGELLGKCDLYFSSETLYNDFTEIRFKMHNGTQDVLDEESAHLAVLVRKDLLEYVWGDEYADRAAELQAHPSLRLFKDVPFVRCDNQYDNTIVEQLFMEQKFTPKVVASASSAEMSLSLCRYGTGAFVAPDGWFLRKLGEKYDMQQLLLVRLPQRYPQMDFVVSYEKEKQLSPVEQLLIELIGKQIDQLFPPCQS